MKQGYFARSWASIKASDKWLSTLLRLGLLQLIPIFGQIVLFGFLGRWNKQLLDGYEAPLPTKIFDNSDGKLYHYGILGWGASFILSMIISVIYSLITAVCAFIPCLGSIAILVIGFFMLFATPAVYALAMRAIHADRFGAAFEFGFLWAGIKRDWGEFLRAGGVYVVTSLILGVIITVLMVIVFAIAMGVGAVNLSAFRIETYGGLPGMPGLQGMSDAEAGAMVLGLYLTMLICMIVVMIPTLIMQAFVSALALRSMTYWSQVYLVPVSPQPVYGNGWPNQQQPYGQPYQQQPYAQPAQGQAGVYQQTSQQGQSGVSYQPQPQSGYPGFDPRSAQPQQPYEPPRQGVVLPENPGEVPTIPDASVSEQSPTDQSSADQASPDQTPHEDDK